MQEESRYQFLSAGAKSLLEVFKRPKNRRGMTYEQFQSIKGFTAAGLDVALIELGRAGYVAMREGRRARSRVQYFGLRAEPIKRDAGAIDAAKERARDASLRAERERQEGGESSDEDAGTSSREIPPPPKREVWDNLDHPGRRRRRRK